MSVINKIDFLLGDGFLREATEFQKFFKKKLKQYGANSPADLPNDKKKKFFDEVDREWKGKNESLSEATLQSIMMQFGPYAAAKKMGILNPKQSGPDTGVVKAYPGSGKEHFHPDKQDTKIPTKDKGTVKSYPGSGKEHYHPDTQDTKIPTKDSGVVKSFPGGGKEHFHPDKQDEKIPTKDKGVLKSYPGSGKEHFHPDKQDDKIPTKDKGTVKSYPGSGKEHFHPETQDTKIPTADKGTVKGFPGDHLVRHKGKGLMGFKQMSEQEDLEDIQDKFGPMKYAEEKGLVDKKKKKKKNAVDDVMKDENKNIFEAYQRSILVTNEEWLEYEKAYGEVLDEKWAKKVKIEKTGEHAGKSVEQLKKEIEALKGKPGNKEKMGELLFALRSKTGWKKGKGAAGLGG